MYSKLIIFSAVVAAMGGLLFGFDTAVISGAEKEIQSLFNLSGFWHGFTVAIALIGTVIGALIAAKPADKFGRKETLIAVAILYAVSALGCAFSNSWVAFIIFRFVGGIGVGASSVVGPMYIAEISPAKIRGRLVALFQFNVVFGILLAFLSNYLIAKHIDLDQWRYMLGAEAVPAVIFLLLLLFIPSTPRYLVLKGDREGALDLMKRLCYEDPTTMLSEIEESMVQSGSNEKLFQKKYIKPIYLAIAIALFNQLSGINAIMYYAPRIFSMAGFAEESAMMQSVIIGFVNLIFTMMGLSIIDKVGRTKLLIVGSIGMVISLGLTAYSFSQGADGGFFTLFSLVGFIGFFAFSQGAVIWVYISEIFPSAVRAKGQTLGSFTHWFMAAVISWLFPMVAKYENGGIVAFIMFAVAMLIQLFIVKGYFPETKGKSLEKIQQEMLKD